MSDDWPEADPEEIPAAKLPARVVLPDDYSARLAVVERAWANLTPRQKTFLSAFRDCRLNARAAARLSGLTIGLHKAAMFTPDYATVVRAWRANVAASALDKDRLLARQEDIVEQLLTPKPILYQGEHTGFEEIDAGAASKANEVLLDRAMPKPRADIEVNVGVAFSPPTVEVVNSVGTENSVDAEFVEVSPALPEGDLDESQGS